MFSRSVILFAAACSLIWIGYVGFTLAEGSNQPPSPKNAFSLSDDTIVVVHKPTELNFNLPAIAKLQANPFYTQLLNEPERIQHFYFATNRKLVLLERSKPWTSEIIQQYASRLNLSVSTSTSKKVSFSNGWKGEFHGKFMILYTGSWTPSKQSIVDWKYLDLKSSVSLVYKTSDGIFEIEDSYLLSDNTTKFISRTNDNALQLVNDQELFQEYIPANFSTYGFYEVSYLKKLEHTPSIVFDWIHYGLAYVVKQNDTCVITDYKPGQDPIAILSELDDAQTTIKGKQASFNKQYIPFLNASTLHLEVFNNVVLIAKSQQVINQLIGEYETAATLAQSVSLKDKLFQNSPQKVSYRLIDQHMQTTLSKLDGVDHKTLQVLKESSKQKDPISIGNKLPPLRLDEDLISLQSISGSNAIIAITKANTLYFINGKQISWSKNLGNELLGQPLVFANGIFLATSKSIYGFDKAGNPLAGFPLEAKQVESELISFFWNGKDYIGFVADRQFLAYTTGGKLMYKAPVKIQSNETLKLAIQGKKGDLIGHITNTNSWSSVSLKRGKALQTVVLPEGNWNLVKINGIVSALGINNKQFLRITEEGKKSMLINNVSKLISKQTYNNEELYFISQQRTVYVITASGVTLGQFSTTISDIEDAALIRSSNGKMLIGIIDGIANNCYFYELKGSELKKEHLEGSNKIIFQKLNDGTILLVSQANGYLIRSPLNY